MRLSNRRSISLCSALVLFAACDGPHTLVAPPAEIAATRMPAAASLVAFYSFDLNVGNGTVSGATHRATGGYQGGAYHFDGVNDFIDLPVNINPSVRSAVTMGAWAWVESIPSGRQAQVLSHDNGAFDRSLGLDMRGLTDNAYHFAAFTGTGVMAGPLAQTGRWVFMAAVYNAPAGTVTLYVDGTQVSRSGLPAAGLSTLRVGGNPAGSASGEYFHGSIDNVFVYNRALSATEIAEIRAGGACVITGTCDKPRQLPTLPVRLR
jgi:Concanavalin A-like lectin/glucanases superfamily